MAPSTGDVVEMNSLNVTNVKIDSLFRTEKVTELRFLRDNNVQQYMLVYTTQFSCEKAHFKLSNYEDHGGEIHFSEFCGHASQICKL